VRAAILRFFPAFCFFTSLVSVAGHALAAERVALVIGNGAYLWTTHLRNPLNDASDIAEALRDMGFDVVLATDVSRQALEAKIREFSRKLAQAQISIFFYAGHGMQVNGQNYLVPIDAKLEQAGDLELDTIDIQMVLRQTETKTRINLVFIDACRDNPLARNYARILGPARSISVARGLATIRGSIGTMIAFATEPNNVALDGSGRNSPFTTALLKHIRTPGLDVAILMRRVRADVIAATGEPHVPWDHSSLVDSLVLIPDGSGGQRATAREPASKLDVPAFGNAWEAKSIDSNQSIVNQSIVYSPWTKFCGKDNNNPQAKEVCLTVKEARLETGQFLAGAALIEQTGEEKKLFRITLPLGMQIPQGTRMLLDKEEPVTGRYVVCLPNGCMADFDITPEFVGKLKNGQQIVMQGINLPGQATSYTLSLDDFTKAHQGPATDPKVFEEQQKKLQEELQKKAEESRNRLQASPPTPRRK
jgi:invasion protein IalB